MGKGRRGRGGPSSRRCRRRPFQRKPASPPRSAGLDWPVLFPTGAQHGLKGLRAAPSVPHPPKMLSPPWQWGPESAQKKRMSSGRLKNLAQYLHFATVIFCHNFVHCWLPKPSSAKSEQKKMKKKSGKLLICPKMTKLHKWKRILTLRGIIEAKEPEYVRFLQ